MFAVRGKSTRKDREAVKQFLHESGLDTPSVRRGADYGDPNGSGAKIERNAEGIPKQYCWMAGVDELKDVAR